MSTVNLLVPETSLSKNTMSSAYQPEPNMNLLMKEFTRPVIETRGLTKTYKGVHVLKSSDLQVDQDSIFGFQGPNGAGKTTTIKLLLGLIRPSAGSTTLFGLDSVVQSVDIRSRVGYLPQETHFYEHLTARQTLRFVARFFFNGPEKSIQERVDEMLELVDLTEKADRPIKNFSGGERQRLGKIDKEQ